MDSTARIIPFLPRNGGKRLAPDLNLFSWVSKSAHAPISLRVAAFVLDWMILAIPFGVTSAIVLLSTMPKLIAQYGPQEGHVYAISIIAGTAVGLYVLMFAGFPILFQGTLGMRLCGLSIVSEAYQAPRWDQHLARFLVTIPSTLFLGAGFLAAVLNEGRQGWHDFFSRTYVVRATEEIRLRRDFLKQLATVHVLDERRPRGVVSNHHDLGRRAG